MKRFMDFRIVCVLVLSCMLIAGSMLTGCGAKKAAQDEHSKGQTCEEETGADSDADKTGSGGGGTPAKNVFGSFTAQTLDGTEVTQDIFKETDLTMVNIWGTFCGPCIREMPELGYAL